MKKFVKIAIRNQFADERERFEDDGDQAHAKGRIQATVSVSEAGETRRGA